MKDLYEEDSVSVINDGDTIKSFCSKYNVDGKHVITYINHLKDIDIRKDITTIEAEKRKRQEVEQTYKDFRWDTLIESGKIEKLKVKELDFYLNEQGLITIDRKLDKVKAIRCHYYRHIKESMNTDRSCGAKDWESDGESEDEEYEEEFHSVEDESDNDFVLNDLFEKSNPSQTIQFISDDEIGEVVVQGS